MVDKPNVNTDTANPQRQGVASPGQSPAQKAPAVTSGTGTAPNVPAKENPSQGVRTSTQPRDREDRVTATEAAARARVENPEPFLTTPDTRTGNALEQDRIRAMTKQERMNMSEADKPMTGLLGFAVGAQIVLEAAAALSETFLRFNALKAQAVAQGRTEFNQGELDQIRSARRKAVDDALKAGNDPTQPAPA